MKKYIILMALIVLLVSVSGCTITGNNQTYDKKGVSFNYPNGWAEMP